jgi:hypothetical protein
VRLFIFSKQGLTDAAEFDLTERIGGRAGFLNLPSPTKMKTTVRSLIASALSGQSVSIQIGRSRNTAGFGSGTPVEIVAGDAPPRLEGRPYLKTTFRNGSFHKVLYTPSTLRAVVGADWLLSQPLATHKK